MQKEKENSHEGITWSEMGKQNVQPKEVYCQKSFKVAGLFSEVPVMTRRSIKKLIRLFPIHVLEVFFLAPALRSEIGQSGRGDSKLAFHKIPFHHPQKDVGSC